MANLNDSPTAGKLTAADLDRARTEEEYLALFHRRVSGARRAPAQMLPAGSDPVAEEPQVDSAWGRLADAPARRGLPVGWMAFAAALVGAAYLAFA